jgi:hypothetical protein
MLHKFGGLPHTATTRPYPNLAVKLASAPGAVKQRHHSLVAKCLLPKDLPLTTNTPLPPDQLPERLLQ